MARLEGKTALITGASRGIGAAIARRLAADGAEIIINYAASRGRAEEVATEIEAAGGKAWLAQADISELAQIDAMFQEVRARAQRVDILVNNAGTGTEPPYLPLDRLTPENYDRVFNLNVRAILFVTQAALRLMPDRGRIIMTSSIAATGRSPGLSVYSGSKAAVDGITRSLAGELAPRGITVNAMDVGVTDTELFATVSEEQRKIYSAGVPMGRLGQPSDIADVAAFLASDDSRWITGESIRVSGGA